VIKLQFLKLARFKEGHHPFKGTVRPDLISPESGTIAKILVWSSTARIYFKGLILTLNFKISRSFFNTKINLIRKISEEQLLWKPFFSLAGALLFDENMKQISEVLPSWMKRYSKVLPKAVIRTLLGDPNSLLKINVWFPHFFETGRLAHKSFLRILECRVIL
jgi:hypothetical protein